MSVSVPANRRISEPVRSKDRVIEAPKDPIGDDDSPLPGPAATTLRPPSGKTRETAIGAFKLVGGILVVVAASLGVAWGARRYITTSHRFAVRTVIVDGNHRRSAQEIARAGDVVVGKNIFEIDLARAGAMVTQDPWIEKATVTRRLPSTIIVTVVEREAAALVSMGGELYLASRDGDLFKKMGRDDPCDLPVITGVLPTQISTDRPGAVLAVRRGLDAAEECERAGIVRRYPIQELHLEKDGSLVVTVGREAIALALGQPPYRDKVETAAKILGEVARRKANAGVIFLDNDAHPERVVVRMR